VPRRSRRLLADAFTAAVVLHLAAGASFLIHRTREAATPDRLVKVLTVLPPPPAINPHAATAAEVSVLNAPRLGLPDPVPDYLATGPSLAPVDLYAGALPQVGPPDPAGTGADSLVYNRASPDGDADPSPDQFVAAEEMPALVSMSAPVFPPLARQAEVDGTVRLRLLVDRNGRVKDVLVTEGNELLSGAAEAAARSAVFRPALQQHRPVEVWVELPVSFRLHD